MDSLRRCLGRAAALVAVAAALSLAPRTHAQEGAPAGAPGVEDLGDNPELAKRRTVQESQERIRLLFTQKKYQEVIDECEALLVIDPNNATAILHKDRAERRLAEGEPEESVERIAGVELKPPPAKTIEVAPIKFDPPPPLAARESALEAFWRENKETVLLGASLLALSLVLAVIMVIRRNRAQAAAYDSPTVAAGMTGLGTRMHDLQTRPEAPPTHVTNERTQVDYEDDVPFPPEAPPLADLPTGQQVYDRPTGAVEADKPSSLVLPPMSRDSVALEGVMMAEAPAPKPAELGEGLGIDYSDTDSPLSASQAQDVYQTGGTPFAGAAAAPVAANVPSSQAITLPPVLGTHEESAISEDMTAVMPPLEDSLPPLVPSDISGPPMIAAPLPPAPPKPAPKPAAPAPKPAPPAMDIAAPPPIFAPPAPLELPPIAPAAVPASSGMAATAPLPPAFGMAGPDESAGGTGAASFNSLMFGGAAADATAAMPPIAAPELPPLAFGAPPPPPAAPAGEDLTLGTFNRQFADVMFGAGSEDTNIAPFSPQVAKPAAGAELGDINSMDTFRAASREVPVPSVDPEGTMPLAVSAPAAASGGAKVSLFDKQRDAGKAAMDAGDFAKAVQCLSVAASLKPADKEVREMLEEARKKRRG